MKITVKLDTGWGNGLFVSGDTEELGNFKRATRMTNINANTWELDVSDQLIGLSFAIYFGSYDVGNIVDTNQLKIENHAKRELLRENVVISLRKNDFKKNDDIKITAKIDTGWGNAVFVSGSDKYFDNGNRATRMENVNSNTWSLEIPGHLSGSQFTFFSGKYDNGSSVKTDSLARFNGEHLIEGNKTYSLDKESNTASADNGCSIS